jgi:hypothetical protein
MEAFEKYYEEVKKGIDAFKVRWPNHCTLCGGWGMFYWRENHERGYSEMFEEPCENLPEGSCHRCGHANTVSEGKPCSNCGWYYNDGTPSY